MSRAMAVRCADWQRLERDNATVNCRERLADRAQMFDEFAR